MSATAALPAGQPTPLLTAPRLAGAGTLVALLVGVALARDVELGLGLLVAALFLPLAMLNLPLAIAIWVPLVFIQVLAPPIYGEVAIMALAFAWLGAVATRSGVVTDVLRRHRGLIVLLALFLSWITLSLIWADDTSAASLLLQKWYYAVAGFFIVATTLSTERHLVGVCVGFVVGALLAFAGALPSLSLEAASATSPEAGRLGGSLQDPNYLADGLLIATVLAAGLMAVTSRRGHRWALGAVIIVLAIGLVATGSRGALIAAGVAVAASLLLLRGRRVKLGGLVVAAVAVAGLWLVTVSPSTLDRVTTVDDGGTGRVGLWGIAWEMGKDHPLVGVGLNNFREESPAYIFQPGELLDAHLVVVEPHVAHSIYLQAFAETGVVGLLLLLLVLLALLRSTWVACRRLDEMGERRLAALARVILIAQIAALSAGSFLSNAHDDRVWIIFALGPVLQTIAARRASETKAA